MELCAAAYDAYQSDLRQLGVKAMCTNRDLPLHMPIGRGNTDFSLETQSSCRPTGGQTSKNQGARDSRA